MARDFFRPLFFPRKFLEKHYDHVEQGAKQMVPQELADEINKRQRLDGPISMAILTLGFVDGMIVLKTFTDSAPAISSLLENIGVARLEANALPVVFVPLIALAIINALYIIGPGRSYVREEEEKILMETAKERRIQMSP